MNEDQRGRRAAAIGLAAVVLSGVATLGLPGQARATTSIVVWGTSNGGQLGGLGNQLNAPTSLPGSTGNATSVVLGSYQGVEIQNGGVYSWGSVLGNGTTSSSNTPVAVTSLSSGVTAIAAGDRFSLAVQNGAAFAWGSNAYLGQLGNGTTSSSNAPVAVSGLSSGVTAIAAGGSGGVAVRGGAVYTWGSNNSGLLGNGSSVNSSTTPVAVTGLSSGVTAVAAGQLDYLAVQNGAVYAWGYNNYGQLGNGTSTNSNVPVAVTGLTSGVTAIAAGSYFSLAVMNGTVYAWGANGNGQLGNGTTTNSATPVAVTGITGTIVALAGSTANSYALAADGSIWACGNNFYGMLGLGSTSPSSASTFRHLLAPAGYAFTSVSANQYYPTAAAVLARPDAALATGAKGPALGTATTPVTGNNVEQELVLSSPTVTGSVQIDPALSDLSQAGVVYLKLDNPAQTSALIVDLNSVYGTGTASASTGNYQVALTLPTSGGSPAYFNFDFTTVVNAGADGASVASVAIDDVGYAAAPEPASLGLLSMACCGMLVRRREDRSRLRRR